MYKGTKYPSFDELSANLTQEQRDAIRRLMEFPDDEPPKKLTAAQLRKKYPALQDAYDQYKTVLKLVEQQEEE